MLMFARSCACAGFIAALQFGFATPQTGDQKKMDEKKAEQKADVKKADDKQSEQKKAEDKKKDDAEKKESDAKSAEKKPDVKTLTEKNRYAKVDLRPGEKLLLQLPANPSTGYTWVLGSKEDSKLRMDGKAGYEADDKNDQVIGGGGIMTFTFVAYEPGDVEVVLNYVRPFEKGRNPEKTFSFTVRIQ